MIPQVEMRRSCSDRVVLKKRNRWEKLLIPARGIVYAKIGAVTMDQVFSMMESWTQGAGTAVREPGAAVLSSAPLFFDPDQRTKKGVPLGLPDDDQ